MYWWLNESCFTMLSCTTSILFVTFNHQYIYLLQDWCSGYLYKVAYQKNLFTISCTFAELHLGPVCFGDPARFSNFSSSSSFTSMAKPHKFWQCQCHLCLFHLTMEMEEIFRNALGKQVKYVLNTQRSRDIILLAPSYRWMETKIIACV